MNLGSENRTLGAWNAQVADRIMTDNAKRRRISREGHDDRQVIRTDIQNAVTQNVIALLASSNNRMSSVIDACRSDVPKCTLGTLASGGCIDTIAAIQTGLLPIWGTEVCERKRALWRRLTRSPDLGDTFQVRWDDKPRPNVIWSGQPCMDYSLSGSRQGAQGDTGWMFQEQTDVLLRVHPDIFVLEMVANAVNVNHGAEVNYVMDRMSSQYKMYHEVLRVSDYGDSSNRERLFIVGVSLSLGEFANDFQFPIPDKPTKVARDIAVPDHQVPRQYWRRLYGRKQQHCHSGRTPGQLQKLLHLAPGMGHSRFPHAIYSWDGELNTQTTHNGGGMRPLLDGRMRNCWIGCA